MRLMCKRQRFKNKQKNVKSFKWQVKQNCNDTNESKKERKKEFELINMFLVLTVFLCCDKREQE